MTAILRCLVTVSFALSFGTALGATLSWVGPTTGTHSWSAPSNWPQGRLPGPEDDVRVEGEGLNLVVTLTGTASIRSLDTTCTLRVVSDLTANSQLRVAQGILNRGALQLESLRADRTSSLVVTGAAGLDNRGMLLARSEGGGGRTVQGAVLNRGVLEVETGVDLRIDNRDRLFRGLEGRVEALGRLLIDGGRVEARGGRWTGEIRLYNAVVDVGPDAMAPLTLRIVGASSMLTGNANPGAVLRLDTESGHNTTLTAQAGAVNVGRIVLGSSRSDRSSRLDVVAGFTNAPTGVLEVALEGGGDRAIQGVLINQGLLTSPGMTTTFTGTYRSDAGRVEGDVRFVNARIQPWRPSGAPTSLQLFGSGSVLEGTLLTNLELRVIADVTAQGVLTASSGFTNQGILSLESLRPDRFAQLDVSGGVVVNRGTLQVKASSGGERRLRGGLLNQGSLVVESNIVLTIDNRNATFTQADGRWESDGTVRIEEGQVEILGGRIRGEPRLYNVTLQVSASVTEPATLRVIGTGSKLVNQSSPWVSLYLDTEFGFQTTLTTQPGASNLGRLRLGSSRDDRFCRIEFGSGFTNAPSGVIETVLDAGGIRQLNGVLWNQGRVLAPELEVAFSGTYVIDGGRADGKVAFNSTRIAPVRPPGEANELSLYGSGSVLLRDNLPNLTLRVISTVAANALLMINTNVVNGGVIRLESERSDRNTTVTGAGGGLVNGPTGRIVSVLTGGGGRGLVGSVRNEGWIVLEHALGFGGSGARHENAGVIELGGQTLTASGSGFLNGVEGRIRGSGALNMAAVPFTNAGVLQPGASPGRIVFTGNFTQADSGGLDVEISGNQGPGTGHDILEVTAGSATLQGGALLTRILGDYVPDPETRFRVLSASGGVSGRFSRTPSLQVLSNRYLEAEYLPAALELRTRSGVNATLPPSIAVHPANREAAEQESVTFTVGVNGQGPFTYQWRRNGQAIPGATSATLSLPQVLAADFGSYDVVVSNPAGSTTSEAAELTPKSGSEQGFDFGDAPDPTYPTVQAHNGAAQRVETGFSLGASVDADNGTQQNSTATADGADDEDGVQFLGPLAQGTNVTIRVIHFRKPTASPGRLSAWIDWARDGSWAQAGDRILNNVALTQRTNDFNVPVPSTAVLGNTYARFRLFVDQNVGYEGLSQEPGEVEDYRVEIVPKGGGGNEPGNTLDFGDAPDSYRTLLASDGARHTRDPELYLGKGVDTENDGVPGILAIGDDVVGSPDDEDGVTGSPVVEPGGIATITITVSGAGKVDAWFDYNRDGDFGDPGERVLTGEAFISQTRTFTLVVPGAAVTGPSYARFRVSRDGLNSWFGAGGPGEVEDYPFLIAKPKEDWGDAPDPFPTLLRDDGPRHRLAQGFHLGKSVDSENDGQPSLNATGDDLAPVGAADDEDGVSLSTPLVPGRTAEVEVEVSADGRLDAWIDFGRDNRWTEVSDRVFSGRQIRAGRNVLSFTVPSSAQPGPTYARFRLSRSGLNTFTGDGGEGEVEDYRVVIEEDSGCDLGCSGTDFWLTFPGNYAPDPANPVAPRLRIVGAAGAAVTISIPGLGTNWVTTLAATGAATVSLPAGVELGGLNDGTLNRGIHVTAASPVSLFAVHRVEYTSDGFLALPTEALTGEYVIAAYPNRQVGVPEISGSQFALVATQPNTRVLITPSYETGLRIAQVPYAVVLTNAGDCYQLRNTNDAPADLTGTIIEADKPVAAFGGHLCANVNSSSVFYCDYLVEQLLPTERLGTDFYTAPLATRTGGDTVRVVAARNNTLVTVNGSSVTLTNRGEVHEVLLAVPARITTSKPVQVMQFSSSSDFDGVANADPFMVTVPARSHYSANHTFATAGTNFTTHHVNVVVPNSVSSLTLNGTAITPTFTAIPGTGYQYARLNPAQGVHTLSASAAFGAFVYGWGPYESYAWPACFFLGDTTPPRLTCPTNQVTLTLGSDSTDVPCKIRTPDFRRTVTVSDDCGIDPQAEIRQDPSPGTLIGVGHHDVTLSVADERGNVGRCVVAVTVIDPAPGNAVSLTCPKDFTVQCEDNGGALVTYSVEALRGCTPIAVECQPPSGSRFPLGTTTVTCRIVEPGVPAQQCSFQVTVTCQPRRQIQLRAPTRPAPTPDNPNPALEILLEWEDDSTAVLEVAPGMEGPWIPVEGARGRYVVKVLGERGRFFRIRADR